MIKNPEIEVLLSAFRNLDFPVMVVDPTGTVLAVSENARANLAPLRKCAPGEPFFLLLDEPPREISAWLEQARFSKAIQFRGEKGKDTAPIMVKSHLVEGSQGCWVLNFHPSNTLSGMKYEREILLRISSVPIPELGNEGRRLEGKEEEESPVTREMLGLVVSYLHGESALFFRLEQFRTLSVVGHYGVSPKGLREILRRINSLDSMRTFYQGPVGAAATSGFSYILREKDFREQSLDVLMEGLDFPCREIWVDGVTAYGCAVTFFQNPPNQGVRQFATDAMGRLGRHLESATYSNNMYEAYIELRQAQEQMIQTSKMAAIGELATGMAHELRQPVTVLNNFFSTIFAQLEAGHFDKLQGRLGEFRERTQRNIERLSGIIDHLRTFGREESEVFRPTDFKRFIEEIFRTFLEGRLAMKNITVRVHIPDSLPRVEMDHSRIEHVFLNLMSNAHDAVEGVDKPVIEVTVENFGDWVRLSVQDNGGGIPPENLGKVLDPFFTTKPVGRGTGVGLSISRGIVESHHGKLEVKNHPEGGVISTVTLPFLQTDSTPIP